MRGRGRSRRGSLFQAAADDAGTGAGSVASVPLKTGDVVTIAAIGNAIDQCLISVDGFADERMAVALTDQQQPAARNQRDSLFRITAQLSYSARDGLKAMQSGPPLPASQMAYERLRAEILDVTLEDFPKKRHLQQRPPDGPQTSRERK